jgi:hypothetical protein
VGSNVYGALRRHWHSWKYDAIQLRFPHGKEFLQKLSTVWSRARRNLCQPWFMLKNLRNIRLSCSHLCRVGCDQDRGAFVFCQYSEIASVSPLSFLGERKKYRILDMYLTEVCVSSCARNSLYCSVRVCHQLVASVNSCQSLLDNDI